MLSHTPTTDDFITKLMSTVNTSCCHVVISMYFGCTNTICLPITKCSPHKLPFYCLSCPCSHCQLARPSSCCCTSAVALMSAPFALILNVTGRAEHMQYEPSVECCLCYALNKHLITTRSTKFIAPLCDRCTFSAMQVHIHNADSL